MGAANIDQLSEQQTEPRRRWSGCTCRRRWWWCAAVAAILVLAGAGFYLDQASGDAPHYSVAIYSVSGLDPSTDLGRRATLNPEFNLTLRVASDKLWASECAEAGMYVEVSYRRVSLAASITTTEQICAAPRKAVDRSVVARGTGVVVPGPVLDSLAGDILRGAQVFDVALHGWGNYLVGSCLPRRVESVPTPC